MNFKQYKQFWFLLLKLSIIFGAGYYIYGQIVANTIFQTKEVLEFAKTTLFDDWKIGLALLSFTLLNWFFEILKWKTLVSSIQSISFFEAFSQCLSAHTLSIITPFKAGEYGGKALYYASSQQKKVLFLNFIGNAIQLLLTISFGTIGLFFFITHFSIHISLHRLRRVGYVIAFLILALFSTKKRFIKKGSNYQRALTFFNNLSNTVKLKTLLFSSLRYVLFSHQFYFLLVVFNVDVFYTTAMMLIFSMYFIATLLPVFSLFDFVLKGSIAIYLFSFVQANDMHILLISTLMWFLNFIIPALIGSYYILVFKPKYKSKFA